VESGSALPTSRAAKQAFIMDLMKLGFIDPNKGLEVMEIGGINKIYEQVQVDVRQAQRENLKMAQATPEILAQHQQEQLMKVLQDPQTQMLIQSGEVQFDPVAQQLTAGGMPLEAPLLVPVNTWDDHRLHIEKHNNYRKSQTFDTLTEEAKALFEQHVNQHVEAIMMGAQAAMGVPPEALQMGANPETYKEAQVNEQAAMEEQQPTPEGMQ
jgi:hypothetical protein